jgi:putative transcriptional regulator
MARVKAESPLLKAVHETASDLARLGLIEKRTMRKYDVLCLAPVEPFDAEKIKKLRRSQKLSQAVLAAVLNTSASTVRQWEAGAKRPSGPSLKLLNLLARKGLDAVA